MYENARGACVAIRLKPIIKQTGVVLASSSVLNIVLLWVGYCITYVLDLP